MPRSLCLDGDANSVLPKPFLKFPIKDIAKSRWVNNIRSLLHLINGFVAFGHCRDCDVVSSFTRANQFSRLGCHALIRIIDDCLQFWRQWIAEIKFGGLSRKHQDKHHRLMRFTFPFRKGFY